MRLRRENTFLFTALALVLGGAVFCQKGKRIMLMGSLNIFLYIVMRKESKGFKASQLNLFKVKERRIER